MTELAVAGLIVLFLISTSLLIRRIEMCNNYKKENEILRRTNKRLREANK